MDIYALDLSIFLIKNLIYFINLFSPSNFKNKDRNVLKVKSKYKTIATFTNKAIKKDDTLKFKLNRIDEIKKIFYKINL